MHWKYWDSLICPSGIFSKGEEKRMKSIQLLKGALLVSRICNDATEVDCFTEDGNKIIVCIRVFRMIELFCVQQTTIANKILPFRGWGQIILLYRVNGLS